jgi:hypothetical protein
MLRRGEAGPEQACNCENQDGEKNPHRSSQNSKAGLNPDIDYAVRLPRRASMPRPHQRAREDAKDVRGRVAVGTITPSATNRGELSMPPLDVLF